MHDLRCCDCMDLMREFPDKHFELAIVDPPYGGGQAFNFRFGEKVYQNLRPSEEYFKEVQRVSENQIIWGGNYFTSSLRESRCWICWFKNNPIPQFSDIELAWCSFDKISRHIALDSYGFNHPDKKTEGKVSHPTQKPVALYRWLLHNYAKPGDKILDTHLGSGSIAIACHEKGFHLTGSELDPDYFAAMQKRLAEATAQGDMFGGGEC